MNKSTIEFYKALSNPIRYQIYLYIVRQTKKFNVSRPQKESCVSEISKALKLPQSTVSNQLKVLKQTGLVKTVHINTRCFQYATVDAAKLLMDESRFLYNHSRGNRINNG